MAMSRARSSNRASTAVEASGRADGPCPDTRGRRKQARDRARNTQQHSSMSRKELKVGLVKVCTAAWLSTWRT